MNATQTTPNEPTTEPDTNTDTDTDSIDADVVQNLSPGDTITVNKLTRGQHQTYLDNPDSKLKDVASDTREYLVLGTPDTDDTRSVFAAKIIRLDDYNKFGSADTVPSPYTTTETDNDDDEQIPEIWNITEPYTPYNDEGTGAIISRLGDGESIVTHIIRDINVTDQKEL